MTPRNRHARTESVPHSDFGAQEFYDEDDLEELDEQADASDLAAFDAEAIDEDEESRLLQMRERATKGGQDDPHVASGQRLQKVLAHAGSPRAAPASSSSPTAASASTASPSPRRASEWTR